MINADIEITQFGHSANAASQPKSCFSGLIVSFLNILEETVWNKETLKGLKLVFWSQT